MTATNHYLTGLGVAVLLKNPLVVLPVALASHFVLDSLPHFGLKFSELRGKALMINALIDFIMLVIAVKLTLSHYPLWYLGAGLVAFSPDIAWIYRFTVSEKFGKLPPAPENKFNAWHSGLQKFERWWGAFVEIAIMGVLFKVLF